MKLLKRLFAVALVALATAQMHAQDSGSFVMASNNVPVLYTNIAPSATVFTVPSYARGYWVWITAASGSTTNSPSEQFVATFGLSADGTAYTTNRAVFQNSVSPSVTNALHVPILANGTNLSTARLFIDMPGARFLKWLTMENPAGGAATNYWTNISATAIAGQR